MKTLRIAIPLLSLLMSATDNCLADIIVSFTNSNPDPLIAGSSGTIDVLIHSNAGDQLHGFLVNIAITPTGGSPSDGLQFSATQNDSQLNDDDYVFYQISQSAITGSFIGQSTTPFDVYSGFDFSDDGSGILLPGGPFPGDPAPVSLTGDNLLLARLDLTAFAAGTYAINLLPSSEFGDELGGVFLFDSTAGSITVNGTAAVPEPSSFALLGLAAAIGGFARRRRNVAMN